jgi:hypothetical protein
MIPEFRCQFCKRDRHATVYVVPPADSSMPDLMLCEHTATTIQSILHAVNGTHPALHAQDTVFSPVLAA